MNATFKRDDRNGLYIEFTSLNTPDELLLKEFMTAEMAYANRRQMVEQKDGVVRVFNRFAIDKRLYKAGNYAQYTFQQGSGQANAYYKRMQGNVYLAIYDGQPWCIKLADYTNSAVENFVFQFNEGAIQRVPGVYMDADTGFEFKVLGCAKTLIDFKAFNMPLNGGNKGEGAIVILK